MQKIYHWILDRGDLVVCISSNLDITLFFFEELDKTKYGRISVILLHTNYTDRGSSEIMPLTHIPAQLDHFHVTDMCM